MSGFHMFDSWDDEDARGMIHALTGEVEVSDPIHFYIKTHILTNAEKVAMPSPSLKQPLRRHRLLTFDGVT
jgi:hypothetical protein